MPRKTPEEKKKLRENLEKAKPAFDRMRQDEAAQNRQWADEIAMLERRVRDEITYVDLGNGDKIALRACLSNAEMTEVARLEKQQRGLGKEMSIPDPTDPKGPQKKIRVLSDEENETANEITFEILELVTANPLLTKEWFRKNQDKFAMEDQLTIIMGYYESRVEETRRRTARLKSAATFRKEPAGPELRGISTLHEDT